MGAAYHLILEVGAFVVLGSVDENVLASPRPVETNEHILEWTAGLRAEGGGGCVIYGIHFKELVS